MDSLRQLGPGAVDRPSPPIFDGLILDNATAPGQEVRCTRPGVDPKAATDPMPWTPYVTPEGLFYPKRDDRAVLAYPIDGPPVILAWWPAEDAAPDKPKLTLQLPFNIDLFGPEPRSSNALLGDKSVLAYGFPGDAFSSSTQFLANQVTGRVVYALWDVAYNPQGGKDCGIELVSFKGNPEGVFNHIAEFTGSASATPLHKQAVITAEIAELWDEAREAGDAKFLGHRLKGNASPSVAPLVFMSRVAMVLSPT